MDNTLRLLDKSNGELLNSYVGHKNESFKVERERENIYIYIYVYVCRESARTRASARARTRASRSNMPGLVYI